MAQNSEDNPQPLHVVQVSYDESILDVADGSDASERQRRYSQVLRRMRPGSRWTVLAVTDGPARTIELGDGAVATAVRARRPGRTGGVVGALRAMDVEMPISVIATQTPADDGWAALWFGRKRGVPVIAQVHFDLFSCMGWAHAIGQGWRGRVRWWMMWRLMSRYAALRIVGRRNRHELLLRRPGLAVETIPVASGWETGQNASEVIERDAGLERRVLFVGRLVAEKNLEGWLRVASVVARRMPRARFDIVGDGPLRGACEAAAMRLSLADRVTFHGQRSAHELAKYYRRAHVFMLLSHCEGFGRAVVEAQRHGLPAVCSRINGIEDIVEHERTGALVEPGDEDAAASWVCRMLEDGSLRERLGQAARERIGRCFNPQSLVEEWVVMLVRTAESRPEALVYSRPQIGGY